METQLIKSPVSVNAEITADLTPLTDAGAEILKSDHKGFAKIADALFGPVLARRIRERQLIDAQTAKDVKDIGEGKLQYDIEARALNECSPPSSGTIDLLQLSTKQSQLEDQQRLFATLGEVAEELKSTSPENVDDNPINKDFFNHWRKEAELIDDDELRRWWAHLLAEETKKPTSISARTLAVASRMTKQEAQIFQKMAKGIFGGSFVLDSSMKPVCGTLNDIVLLQDAGILGSQHLERTISHNIDINDQPGVQIIFGNKYILLALKKSIKFPFYPLTIAGQELLKTLGFTFTQDDVIAIANALYSKDSSCKMALFECTETSSDGKSYTVQFNINNPLWKSKVY